VLQQLVNKEAEFRDDEKHPELQAADLLAYHQRKFIYETTQMNNRAYAETPIWKMLQSTKVEALNLRYEAKQWRQLVGNVMNPFSPFNIPIEPVASRR
jgi:hypothetical protein